MPTRHRRTTTSGSRCRCADVATKRAQRSSRRCASIPTTRRRTTISARCCSLPAALALRADNAQALAGIAWIRATAADESLRDSDQAIALAERAAAATGRRNLSVLDALAAAYASAGRFEDA